MLSIQHPQSSQRWFGAFTPAQQHVRAAVTALCVLDCSAGLGTPQQNSDSPEFGHSGFFKPPTCIRSCSADRAVPLEERQPWARMIAGMKALTAVGSESPAGCSSLLSEQHCLHHHTQGTLNTFDISPCRLPTDTLSQDCSPWLPRPPRL